MRPRRRRPLRRALRSPRREQVVRGTDAVGEHERETARRRLVHDDGPRSRARRGARRRPPPRTARRSAPSRGRRVSTSRTPSSRASRSRRWTLDALAREDEQELRVGRDGDCSHEVVEPFLGRETRDAEDDHVVVAPRRDALRSSGRRLARRDALAPELLDVDGVREHAHAIRGRSARNHRVAGERARDEDARRTRDDGRDDGAFTFRRHPAAALRRGSPRRGRTGRHEPAPRDRGLRRERAPAGDDDDVGAGRR